MWLVWVRIQRTWLDVDRWSSVPTRNRSSKRLNKSRFKVNKRVFKYGKMDKRYFPECSWKEGGTLQPGDLLESLKWFGLPDLNHSIAVLQLHIQLLSLGSKIPMCNVSLHRGSLCFTSGAASLTLSVLNIFLNGTLWW